ncbi:MAG: bifunctional diaminohydroxyphosphoribosylaminopyrimidine deaminase/5-amino-6-(5-phosphoribosylamino)uracil reductase RibD [Planctomycetota bacterium]|nr:bifunctional diaminohydroxyphosphoribosylaminopyrimidine deaminase/5-amino-6-(5-phosphoribosylamino)uracil reductase RibD [Planctomycetota bacterium]
MDRAVELAKNGEGRVAPNPPVGCVLVRDGAVVGEGWHDRCGDLHAEAMAIRAAGGKAQGATVYVTLSPCTAWGRQPPCVEALADAGVAEVVAAVRDPNPRNAGGIERLRELSVPTRVGLRAEEAEYVARGFFKRARSGTAYVTLKYAMTLDGKIATPSGDSRWVSGGESRELVHDLRSRSDAILIGVGAALADDPLLTVRGEALARRGGPERHPQPKRVVLDSDARTPPTAKMLVSPGGRVIIVTCVPTEHPRARALADAGADILPTPRDGMGKVFLPDALRALSRMGVNSVLCEGGSGVAAALLRERMVDEVLAFIAPKLLGSGLSPVGDAGLTRMNQALPVAVRECVPVGSDILIRGVLAFETEGTSAKG